MPAPPRTGTAITGTAIWNPLVLRSVRSLAPGRAQGPFFQLANLAQELDLGLIQFKV